MMCVIVLGVLAAVADARAEVEAIRIGRQPGLTYLPLIVMQHDQLLDRRAREAGLAGLAYKPVQLGSAGALNDALLSGSVDMVAGAITVMAVLTDKTRGTLDVRGIAALTRTIGQSRPCAISPSATASRSARSSCRSTPS